MILSKFRSLWDDSKTNCHIICLLFAHFFNSLTQKIMLQVVSYLFRLVRFESRLLPSATNTTRDIFLFFLQIQFYALPCVIWWFKLPFLFREHWLPFIWFNLHVKVFASFNDWPNLLVASTFLNNILSRLIWWETVYHHKHDRFVSS